MNKERALDKIIEDHLSAIVVGRETLTAVLEMYPKDQKYLRPRFESAIWLAKASQSLGPRPGFISSSRKYLEHRLVSMPAPSGLQRFFARHSLRVWLVNLTVPVILFILVALVINNLVLTAQLSIPGDPLYSTKLVIEDMQMTFTFDLVERTNLHMQHSRERATELIELVMEGNYNYLPASASRMESEIIASLHSLRDVSANNTTPDIHSIKSLRDTLSTEIDMLNILKGTSPAASLPGIELAIQASYTGLFGLNNPAY